jgi:caa(3)-type oxidase subunit IV
MAEKIESTTNSEEQSVVNRNEAYRIGIVVLVLLGVFTIGEYWLGSIAIGWWAPLVAIAILKAALVIRDYMHIGRVFAGEEEAH